VSEEKAQKKKRSDRDRILEAAATFPNGESMSRIIAKAHVPHTKEASRLFKTLVAEDELVKCEVNKKGGTGLGFRLAQAL
jgi:hypothetical protein